MAVVVSPLHSLTAHGDFGKIITYRRVGKNNVVSQYHAPKDQDSNAQRAHRICMHDARTAWRSLSTSEKERWNDKAINIPGTSGYNLFIKNHLQSLFSDIKPAFNTRTFNTPNFC